MASPPNPNKKSRAAYMRHYRSWRRHENFEHGDQRELDVSSEEDCTHTVKSSSESDNSTHFDLDVSAAEELVFHTENYDDIAPSSEEDSTSVSETQQLKTRTFLRSWALENNPTVDSLNQLLQHLNMFMPGIPKTGATLKQTCLNVDVGNLCGGQYFYLSVKEAIDTFLRDFPDETALEVTVNVDGVLAYRSKKHSFWPIVITLNKSNPYLVAVWYGEKKQMMFISS